METTVHTICVNSPEYVATLAAYVVVGASTLANFIPSPDKVTNPFLRTLSRIVHFVAVDVVTATEKK